MKIPHSLLGSRRLVRIMRIACPATALVALGLCAFALTRGLNFIAVVNAALFGVNLVLSWVEWSIFEL
jgi:hypothetical protein